MFPRILSRADADAVSAPSRREALPNDARANLLLGLAGAWFFAGLTAFGAQVSVPLPPFGVPQTLQTLMVVLAAVCLGPKWGAASMVIYIGAGVIGAPVFSDGAAGPAVMFGQTGGYILGFLACQPVVHRIVRRGDGSVRPAWTLAVAVVAAHLVIFALGVPVLYLVRSIDPGLVEAYGRLTWGQALWGGMVIFLPGMVVKAAIAFVIGLWALPFSASRRGW